jgi:hypothetical protein
VAIHRRDTTGFYGVEQFLAGGKRLYPIDSGELGEIAGKRLIHQEHEGRLVTEWAADTPIDEPLVFDEAQTYTGDPTPLTASRTYQWIHSLPRILCALTATGLVLDFVHEHLWLPWPPFPMCVRSGNGAYCLPKGAPALPLAVSLRAVKSRTARTYISDSFRWRGSGGRPRRVRCRRILLVAVRPGEGWLTEQTPAVRP